MDVILLRGGQALGGLGFLLMAVAAATRLSGRYVLGGFETGSLLLAAVAAFCGGCFALLCVLIDRK